MLCTEAVSLMNRDRALHSLETNTVEVPSLIFFVATLGTFRSQAAEDLRVYVRGQKMIDSLDLGRSQNILCFKNLEAGSIMLQPGVRSKFFTL